MTALGTYAVLLINIAAPSQYSCCCASWFCRHQYRRVPGPPPRYLLAAQDAIALRRRDLGPKVVPAAVQQRGRAQAGGALAANAAVAAASVQQQPRQQTTWGRKVSAAATVAAAIPTT